jgi:uncharacterized membrane protein YedE/YeeE
LKVKVIGSEKSISAPQPYWNPYIAGIGLGLVLLAAFVIMGRGLGASGAFSTVVSTGINAIDPSVGEKNEFFSTYSNQFSANPLNDWYVIEIIGVLIGGFISGYLSHRIKTTVDKGPNISVKGRFAYAFIGGAIMGMGAKLARGCTSGQALTGGAQLNIGSWLFMIFLFIGGYAAAYFVRRQWI